ncbi:MAG: AraC family transcriptional regulator [Ruminococcaceae bacterium]|nr:AraC family transcriptional regulator [Oscillospiraceae bacterium]
MLGEVKNLKIKSAIIQTARRLGEVNSRKADTFIFRISGTMEYTFGTAAFFLNPGEMIFLPKGCSYRYRAASEEDCVGTIINFEGDFQSDEPRIYSLDNFYHNDCFFNNFADMWNFGNTGERYLCVSKIYELLSYLYNYENLMYMDKKKSAVIEPAMLYLKNHMYDTDLKIDKLHRMCGLSHTYFRRIFTSQVGMSPKEYVIEKRMSRAKVIIDIGYMETVKQLALSVGYSDPLYFSKAFKKQYGVSPLKMNLAE